MSMNNRIFNYLAMVIAWLCVPIAMVLAFFKHGFTGTYNGLLNAVDHQREWWRDVRR